MDAVAEAVAPVGDGGLRAKHARAASLGGHVHTTAETAAGAGDDDRLHALVLVGALDRVVPFGEHLVVEGVEAFRLVEGDGGDAIVDVVKDGFVAHGSSRLRWWWHSRGRPARVLA